MTSENSWDKSRDNDVPDTQKNRKAKAGTREYAEVKQAMITAATELMAEQGYRKFRFEELPDHVGYNRATIYRYFDSKKVTPKTFTDALYNIITKLRNDPRCAIVMDADNVEKFSQLTHDHFSKITTSMLEKCMLEYPGGRVLQAGIDLPSAVHWLIHQIISYDFLGLRGDNEKQQKAYLEKMVVSVII